MLNRTEKSIREKYVGQLMYEKLCEVANMRAYLSLYYLDSPTSTKQTKCKTKCINMYKE